MSNKFKFIGISIVAALVIIYVIIKINIEYVKVDNVTEGDAYFIHNTTYIHEELSDNDLETIKEIFDGQKLYNDNPSCGFSEDVSLVFDDTESFYILPVTIVQ